MVQPLVTVVTPAFNVGEYIEATIESVIAQTYGSWEYVIVDDASSDNTAAIAERFSKTDSRIRVIRAEHGGSSAARNVALRHARGDYVAFVDGDDLWAPTFLERTVSHLQSSSSDVVGAFAASRMFSEANSDLGTIPVEDRAYSARDMLRGWNPTGNGSCLVLRHAAVMQAGSFDETLASAVDLDFLMRLLGISPTACMDGISERLVSYRQRPGAISANLQKRFDALEIMLSRYGKYLRPADKKAFSYPIIMGFENGRDTAAVRLFFKSFPLGPLNAVVSKEWRRIWVLVFFATLGMPLAKPAHSIKRALRRSPASAPTPHTS